jgi:NADH dehydrogenase
VILVAGGTGQLGRDVVGRLVARGLPVRVLTRDVVLGRTALGPLADELELVAGDVRDLATLTPAMHGVDTVVAAVQGFGGREAGGIAAVDRDGNRNLVQAAAAAGVGRFVLLSIHDASMQDSLALGRAKAAVEADLHATAMTPLVVRPTAYMETWAAVIGSPILASGRARVFGGGRNPINFVSVADVAAVVEELAANVDGAGNPGRTIEVVGPEDLSFEDVVARFSAALGRPVPASHVPLPMLRAMAVALRPFKPILAAQVAAAAVLDTTDRTARDAVGGPATFHRGTTTFETVIHGFVAASRSATRAPAGA